jgi:uncharacterized protein
LPCGGVNLNNRHHLRLNVGFLIHQSVGYSRNFDYDLPSVRVDSGLDVTDFQGNLQLTRTHQGLLAQGKMQASTQLDCVRCIQPYNQLLQISIETLFVYPSSKATDPLLSIPETGILDLGPLLREYLLLAIPIQPLCSPDCKGLCPICGINRNLYHCDHPLTEVDPRLEILKTLLPK